MYLYKITNQINDKIYIGITNNPTRRWANHGSRSDDSVISRAIKKYGKSNFVFEILLEGLSEKEAEEKEVLYIKTYNSTDPKVGYNIASGGRYNRWEGQNTGENNPKASLTDAEVRVIKDRRDEPLYLLYKEYREKVSYKTFCKIYYDLSWTHIPAKKPIYPYNAQFSGQFANSNFTYEEIVKIREAWVQGTPPKDEYEKWRHKGVSYETFGQIYRGDSFSLIRPEVFSEENNKRVRSNSKSGENNSRAKLSSQDVLEIRKRAENGEMPAAIHKSYPQVTLTSIKNIINYKTWKNV